MPHKMNARSCERIGGFKTLLQGYAAMAAALAGNQWNEGDVSCSVVRRVLLPDSIFACDGLLETFLTVLDQFEAYPGVIAQENERYLPFLLTTTVLMEAVSRGMGRENAHAAIKEHALSAAHELRGGDSRENTLFARLAGDSRIGLSRVDLQAIEARAAELVGNAGIQTDRFIEDARALAKCDPDAAKYQPDSIL